MRLSLRRLGTVAGHHLKPDRSNIQSLPSGFTIKVRSIATYDPRISPPSDRLVLINGTPAPLLFVSPTQINLQVPFETSTADAPQLQLIWPSGEMSVQLSISRSPGIFTVDGLHAAALNADGTVNSPANPAAAGSLVSLFGTGGIWPSGMQDGAVATAALQLSYGNEFEALGWFQGPVNLIQTPLYISYAGAAPGLIDGVFQVNVQLPPGPAQPGLSSSITLQSGTPGYSVASNTVYVYTK